MEPKMIDLLEKGNLFFGGGDIFRGKIEILPMEKFRFFLPNCFWTAEKDPERCFAPQLRSFIRRYLEAWLGIVEVDPQKPFDWKKYNTASIDCFLFLTKNVVNFYNQVVSGEETVIVPIFANNSQLLIRRMGDILVFNVSHYSSPEKEHVTGIRAVESLCRAHDPNSNQGVYELIQSINISFLLPKECTENGGNERRIDFESVGNMLQVASPDVEWDFNPESLINAYLKMEKEGVVIGRYFNLNIRGHLLHGDSVDDRNNIKSSNYPYESDAKVWRSGNVSEISKAEYLFRVADDIRIVLSIESSLPRSVYSSNSVNIELAAHREQFILATAGSIFIAQISAKLAHMNRKRSIELGN